MRDIGVGAEEASYVDCGFGVANCCGQVLTWSKL